MRILTGKEAALSFQEHVLNFGEEVLLFHVKGLTHFDVNSFTFNEQEMDMANIALDMFVEPDMIPDFTDEWYVDFRGERFNLVTLEPAVLKDTSSRLYRYSLIFRSERDDLQRYQFANFVSVEETPQPVSYDFVLPLTIQEFIERVNINLSYYLSGWSIVLNPSYTDTDNINTDIYNGTDRITVSFSRQSIWNVIQSIYETFGLRWTISGTTIWVGYPQSAMNHVFEYGKDNGLISIERVNNNENVFTRLSGKGSNRNLPYRYFKSGTDDFIQDPDNNELTSLMRINSLMPASYRRYVQGWNDSAQSMPPQSSDQAYMSGWNAENTGSRFIPQDFVIDNVAEAKYGLRHTSIDDNDEIYPTLRTPIVGVEVIEADKDVTTVTQEPVGEHLVINRALPIDPSVKRFGDSVQTQVFSVSEDLSSIESKLSISYPSTNTIRGTIYAKVLLIKDGTEVDSKTVAKTSAVESEDDIIFYSVQAGSYVIRMDVLVDFTNVSYPTNQQPTIAFELEQPIATVSVTKKYKKTFDIWIGNVWDTSKNAGDTDAKYVSDVWDPLASPLGDMTVMFAEGSLAGADYEFKILDGGIHYDTSKPGSHWRLSLIKSDAEYEAGGYMLPDSDRNAVVGDDIFFINIEMPYHPYVYDAEEMLEEYLEKQLSLISTENPTYTIKPSSIFLESFDENESVKVGTVIPIKNQHIIGEDILYLTISNLSITYTSDKTLPTWDILVSAIPDTGKNSIETLQGDVKVLSTSVKSAQNVAEQITLQMDSRYLRRDGDAQKSYSPTTFSRPVTVDELRSSEFLQGVFGGHGYSLGKNADGDFILEVDKISVRKSLSVNELIINQISAHGGIHIYSAASMSVSRIADGKIYFDTKNGTVRNQFVVGDFARGQRFNPSTSYWVAVTEVGADYIVLDGGSPMVGDVIAQLGNASDTSRQSALIIDQTNGGTVTQYAFINTTSLDERDFVRYGVNPSTGKAFNITYGDAYIGGRNPATDNYFAFDQGTGELSYRGVIRQESTVVDEDGNPSPMQVERGAYLTTAQYYSGNTVQYNGSTYYCFLKPPKKDIPPTDTMYWRVYAVAGENGINAKLLTLSATSQSIKETELGVRTPSSIVLSAVQQNTTITTWEYKIDNGAWTTTKPAWISETSSTTRTIATTAFAATNLSVRVSDGTVSDVVTIALLKDGDSVYNVILSNESHTLPCDTEGNVSEQATTTVKVYRGSTELTLDSDWSFAALTPSTGATIARVGAVVSTTSFAAEQSSGYVDINVSVGGLTLTKRWVLTKSYEGVQGDTGLQGIQGIKGADGTTYYTWVRYADTPTTGMSQYPTGKAYIGFAYNKTTATEGSDYADYKWSLIKGEQGIQGDKGADGTQYYTWIKYADTPTTGMSDNPTGKTYIGIAVNKTTATESTTYGDYTWQLTKGEKGDTGTSNLSLITSTPSISVTPAGDTFTQSIQVRLQYGTSFISVAEWSKLDITYDGLTYSPISTPSASVLSINLTGFTNPTTTVGYVTINVMHFETPLTLVLSVARVFNPIQVAKGLYVSGQTYTGNCIQRDVVSYSGGHYAVKPTVGTTSSTWVWAEWEALNSYKNVATDSLFAEQANVAGFIYLNGKMSSQTGTINGDSSTNWAHPDFVPNLMLDGGTGLLSARGATIYGDIYAQSGEISGFKIDGSGFKYGSPENWSSPSYASDYALLSRNSIKIQDTDSYAGSVYNRTKVGFGKGSDPYDSTNKIAGYIYRNYIQADQYAPDMYAPALMVTSDNGHHRDVAIKSTGAIVLDGAMVNIGRFMDISDPLSANKIDLSFGNNICVMTTVFRTLYLPTKQNIINIIGENRPFCVEFSIFIDRRSTQNIRLAFEPGESTLGFLGYNGTTVFNYEDMGKGDSMRLMLVWDGSEYFAQILSHQN